MWTGRLRTRRVRPVTYWEEFVETDEWYIKELVADVPAEELQAALVDEDFSEDIEMHSDAACSDDGGRDEGAESESDDDVSESDDDLTYCTESSSDGGDDDASAGTSDEEGEASEGQSGSQGTDATSPSKSKA